MGLEYAVILHSLKRKFDSCYDDYIEELLELEAGQIIESASEIVAMKETHYEMCFWLELSMSKTTAWPIALIDKPINEQDATTLLSLENPLKELGQKWWFYTLGNKVDFYEFYDLQNHESLGGGG